MLINGPREWNVHVKSKKHRKAAMHTLKEDLRSLEVGDAKDAWATAMMGDGDDDGTGEEGEVLR